MLDTLDSWGGFFFCLLVVSLPIYFVPSFVAYSRNHRNFLAIFLLNLFLGWALVGWVGALVWAVLEGEDQVALGQPATPLRGDSARPI